MAEEPAPSTQGQSGNYTFDQIILFLTDPKAMKGLETEFSTQATKAGIIDPIKRAEFISEKRNEFLRAIGTQLIEQVKIKGQADAIKTLLANVPEGNKKYFEDILKLYLEGGMNDAKTLEKYRNNHMDLQAKIITEAFEAGISGYKAMQTLSSLGMVVGGIAAMIGQASGNQGWVEFGQGAMAMSMKFANEAERGILAKQKLLEQIEKRPPGYNEDLKELDQRVVARMPVYAKLLKDLNVSKEIYDYLINAFTESMRKNGFSEDAIAKARADLIAARENASETPGAPGSIPLSIRNKNPGNLRPVGATKGFQTFPTDEAGLKAMYDDLADKISGKSKAMTSRLGKSYSPTLRNLISVWAPSTENETEVYIQRVARETGIKPDQVLTLADIPKLMTPMIAHEGGSAAVDYFRPTIEKMYGVPVVNGPDFQIKSKGITILRDKDGKDMKLGIDFSRASRHLDISGGTSGAGGITFDPNAAALSMDGDQGSFTSGTRIKPFVVFEPPRPVGAGGQ